MFKNLFNCLFSGTLGGAQITGYIQPELNLSGRVVIKAFDKTTVINQAMLQTFSIIPKSKAQV